MDIEREAELQYLGKGVEKHKLSCEPGMKYSMRFLASHRIISFITYHAQLHPTSSIYLPKSSRCRPLQTPQQTTTNAPLITRFPKKKPVSAMASIQLDAVKAVLAWQHNGTPRYLAEPDPKSSSIRFTLHLNTTLALFEIQIPISYKQHTKTSAIYIHVNPRSIISFTPSVEQDVPDPVKPVLGSTICLNFELNDAITILIPSFISEPVTAARLRSGVI
ncbi:hypothetical protein IWW34DRAFT_554722, partial [Fusarium oxysporum f. sp. albedinis]